MSFKPDPYRTLGLTRGASIEEVKRAYRRLAKANHPDAAGASALPRFLAIQAAYEELVGIPGTEAPGRRTGASGTRRPSTADPDRTDATYRAYRGRQRERPGTDGSEDGAGHRRRESDDRRPGTTGRSRSGATGEPRSRPPGGPSRGGPTEAGGGARTGRARGKATLGSTSYDDAEAGSFEPDWGGASWYGTTSGTYWTINPKEYADPRKHGPEYQARARRAAGGRGATPDGVSGDPTSGDADAHLNESGSRPPTHTTTSWWESTSGPEPAEGSRDASAAEPRGRPFEAGSEGATHRQPAGSQPGHGSERAADLDEPAPDPARAAIDLGRSLTDPRSGGLRGRAVRAVLGWLPIALGLGWLVGELTGCGRFAATCDPAVGPLTYVGQAIVLAVLLLLSEIAAVASGAALVLLAAATAASLILSATGSAADEASRRAALGALLLIAWLSGLAIAIVRRVRSRPRPSRPVS